MHSPSQGFQTRIKTTALVLLPVTLWLLLRGYHGLIGDAQIYAFQALARIHRSLASDLYLQNTSQDQFTIFSPLYAWFIQVLGLEGAARWLTLFFTAWFLTAAWNLVRAVAGRDEAWLAICFLLIIDDSYGGSGVFRFADQFLTARLPAEALVATSLACFVRNWKVPAIGMAILGFLFHPLVALPGILLLICLWVPRAFACGAAVAGVLAAAGVALGAARFEFIAHAFPLMDGSWLQVVQERSQFLFLQLWSLRDWELNALPFLYLAFIWLAIQSVQIRRLCAAAALVSASGLAVALIASLLDPVAILVQGQAWRWVWIAVFVGAALLPATILKIWRDKQCGRLCAILLASGWTISAAVGIACVSVAMALWVMRARLGTLTVVLLRSLSLSLLAAIMAYLFFRGWVSVAPEVGLTSSASEGSPSLAMYIQEIFGLKIVAVFGVALICWVLRAARTSVAPVVLAVALFGVSAFLLPRAFKQSRVFSAAATTGEFSDWQRIIPPTSTVLEVPASDVGSFVWFTLLRPNYLALDQSAGVVFSRATALEIQRRSNILLPISEPDWKILSRIRQGAALGRRIDVKTHPLNAANLLQICADPNLGFVISPQNIGLNSFRHMQPGEWKDWNLYDCRQVRPPDPQK